MKKVKFIFVVLFVFTYVCHTNAKNQLTTLNSYTPYYKTEIKFSDSSENNYNIENINKYSLLIVYYNKYISDPSPINEHLLKDQLIKVLTPLPVIHTVNTECFFNNIFQNIKSVNKYANTWEEFTNIFKTQIMKKEIFTICKDACREINITVNSKYYRQSMIDVCIRGFETEFSDASDYFIDDVYEMCECITEEFKNLLLKQYTKTSTDKECRNILETVNKIEVIDKCITQFDRNMK